MLFEFRPSLTTLYRSINRGCPSQAIWCGSVAYPVSDNLSHSFIIQPLSYLMSWKRPTKHVSLLYPVLISMLNVSFTGCRFDITSDSRRGYYYGQSRSQSGFQSKLKDPLPVLLQLTTT